jgi:tetratricopeptide (TPR) repeat protein
MIREKGWLFALGCIPLIVGLLVTLPSYAQDPEVSALVDQAWQLRKAGQLANALAVAERAVTVAEQRLGAEHVEVASALQILADLLADQHRRHDAEVAYFRALAIYERTGHQSGALVLLSLARLREAEGQLAEAEKLHRRALALQEKLGGPDHLMIPAFAGALAELLTRTGAYKEAEALSRRAIAISERSFGPEHDFTARHLNDLALVLKLTNRREEAEAIYVRALGIYEFRLGPDHLSVATTLNNLGTLYLDMGRFAEAESLLSRSLAIREKGGVASPGVTVALSNLAEVLHKANRLLDAEPLYRRALSIDEKLSGAEHPDVARDAHNLATLLLSITATLNQNRTAEAEMLFQRAQSIYEKALGPKHPTIAKIENNRAVLLALREEWTEALKHFRRATDIVTRQSASAFSRLMLLGNQTGFLLHALAAYKAAKTDVEARDEAFVAAQWAVQHTTAASLSQMSARLAAGGGRLVEPIRKQQDLMRERSEVDSRLLSAIGRMDVALVQQLNSALAEIERKLDEIERQLSKDFPEYTALANPIPLRLTEVQDLLSNDEGLIVWVQGYNVSISWVITKTQIRWVQIPLGSKQNCRSCSRASVWSRLCCVGGRGCEPLQPADQRAVRDIRDQCRQAASLRPFPRARALSGFVWSVRGCDQG